MFTGIVEEVGKVTSIREERGTRRMTVSASNLIKELKAGDSIAVSGVCLTAVDLKPNSVGFDLAEETWNRTSFSHIHEGALVNLELPMRADGRFGGHIVQGHVDGTGEFLSLDRIPDAEDYLLHIRIPAELARYVIFKGSLSIEGISLTVVGIEDTDVTVAIIPPHLGDDEPALAQSRRSRQPRGRYDRQVRREDDEGRNRHQPHHAGDAGAGRILGASGRSLSNSRTRPPAATSERKPQAEFNLPGRPESIDAGAGPQSVHVVIRSDRAVDLSRACREQAI